MPDDMKNVPVHPEPQGELDQRVTWNEGDLVIIGPDGKPVDLTKAADRPPPTLHIYLPDDFGDGEGE